MAIDLPPALPPQLADLEQVSAYAAGASPYVGQINDFELRLTGDHYLSEQELARIFELAKTPSQAIMLINTATARKGNMLVTYYYAPRQNTIHVHAFQNTLESVEGAEAITPYFKGLEGDQDLKRAEFDRARVMANIRSDRSGVDYTVSYRGEDEPGTVSLVFEESPRDDHDATDIILQFGNQGSRFVGRYFADLGLAHNFSNGSRFSFGYQTAITDFGETRDGDDYEQFSLSFDHPTRFGLYGIEANYFEYTQDLRDVPVTTTDCSIQIPLLGQCLATSTTTTFTNIELDAEVLRVALNGEQVISSDLNRRFNTFQRIEYIDSQIKASGGFRFQDEEYTSLELGAKYHRATMLWGNPLQWNVTGSVKGGVTGDKGTLGTAGDFEQAFGQPAPEVSPQRRTAEYILFKPRAGAALSLTESSTLKLDFSAQIADEQLPQQQQWVLGGINSLSAYLPGILVGDTGYFTRASYDYRWDFGSAKLTFSLFGEYGAASFEDAGGSAGDTRSIADAGIRLKADLWDILSIEAVAAESLSERNLDNDYLKRNEADFFFIVKAVF